MSEFQPTPLKQVEISIDNAKKAMDLAEALKRLHDNPDFKAVILEDYFHEEAHRAVLLKADQHMMTPEKQQMIDDVITSIGGLYNYFGKIYRMAEMSARALEADQGTRQELLEEEMGEGIAVQ
jgi:hypothetical protein